MPFGLIKRDAKVRVTVKEAEKAAAPDSFEEQLETVPETPEGPAPKEEPEVTEAPVSSDAEEERKAAAKMPRPFWKPFSRPWDGSHHRKFINRKDGEIELKLHGDGLGVLIGKHGQTLDSLQYLTNLAANKGKKEWHRIVLDAENYRKRRRDTLEKLAHNLAHRVKRTGRKALLEPMNPYERKIVHEALQNEPGIVTYSEGEEPYRKVVIDLK